MCNAALSNQNWRKIFAFIKEQKGIYADSEKIADVFLILFYGYSALGCYQSIEAIACTNAFRGI